MSHEAARQIVLREGRKFVDSVELDLYVAAKLERMGREASWPTLLVPFQHQEDWQTALRLLSWLVDRLRGRDVPVHIRTPTDFGRACVHVEPGGVMTVTATHRQRLESLRTRTKTARSQRANARELLDAARDGSDIDAQAVAQIAYDQADVELQTAERLESQLLSSISGLGVNGQGPLTQSVFEDPDAIASLERLASSSMPIGPDRPWADAVARGHPRDDRVRLVGIVDSGGRRR